MSNYRLLIYYIIWYCIMQYRTPLYLIYILLLDAWSTALIVLDPLSFVGTPSMQQDSFLFSSNQWKHGGQEFSKMIDTKKEARWGWVLKLLSQFYLLKLLSSQFYILLLLDLNLGYRWAGAELHDGVKQSNIRGLLRKKYVGDITRDDHPGVTADGLFHNRYDWDTLYIDGACLS